MGERDVVNTSVDRISTALNDIFQGLEGSYVKSGNANRLIITGSTHLKLAHDWVEAMAQVTPGRFFIVNLDNNASAIKVQLSARCSQLTRGQSVCSEVIVFTCATDQLAALPSLVRAHLLTSRRVELILFPDVSLAASYTELIELGEFLLIDSGLFWGQRDFLLDCLERFERVIDLQWILLAPWREAIRSAFERSEVRRELPNYNRFDITLAKAAAPLVADLLSGWVCSSLNNRAVARKGQGFECRSTGGQIFSINWDTADKPTSRGISSVIFSGANRLELILDRDFRLQVVLDGHVLLVDRVEPLTGLEALTRYFAVGESTVGYADSMRKALEFAQLEQGHL